MLGLARVADSGHNFKHCQAEHCYADAEQLPSEKRPADTDSTGCCAELLKFRLSPTAFGNQTISQDMP